MEAMDTHQAMNIVKRGSLALPSDTTISSNAGRRLCNVISAYRLVDILFALQAPTPTFQNPRYGKLPLKGLTPDGKVRISP